MLQTYAPLHSTLRDVDGALALYEDLLAMGIPESIEGRIRLRVGYYLARRGERNQAFTDAGMFAMTLLYAFHAQGIASCGLNLCTSFLQDIAFRRVCGISRWETPVMLIAIGYPPETLQVAAAARVRTEDILSFRYLDTERKAKGAAKAAGLRN